MKLIGSTLLFLGSLFAVAAQDLPGYMEDDEIAYVVLRAAKNVMKAAEQMKSEYTADQPDCFDEMENCKLI